MTDVGAKIDVPKKHRQRGKNRRIGFSQEIVTKNVAETLLSHEDRKLSTESNVENVEGVKSEVKQSIVEKILDNQSNETLRLEQISDNVAQQSNIRNKKKTKRKNKDALSKVINVNIENSNDSIPSLPKKSKTDDIKDNANDMKDIDKSEKIKETKNSLSKRAIKRMKHKQLLEEKKKQVDEKLKESSLNYISNWKYHKINWKFEKLKQIWLIQNLYDPNKIEEPIWSVVVEYFSHSKGEVYKRILQEAIKIVENQKNVIGTNEEIKLKRARDLIQNLQD